MKVIGGTEKTEGGTGVKDNSTDRLSRPELFFVFSIFLLLDTFVKGGRLSVLDQRLSFSFEVVSSLTSHLK